MHGSLAFERCLKLPVETILDVGSGPSTHADLFRSEDKKVVTLDFDQADICGDFLDVDVPKLDLIWCCHVLEHAPNVGSFLAKVLDNSKWFAVTVPPAKHAIVGGHLTLWNAGLLLYNLVLAGFDCANAMVKSYGYNISVIVESKRRPDVDLRMDYGDIETLSPYFPFPARQGFDGQIKDINW